MQNNDINNRAPWQGHIALIFANMSWGLLSPVSKQVLNLGALSSIGLSGVRILGGTILFWLVSLLCPESILKHEHVNARDLVTIFVCSILIITVNQALYIVGIGLTSPIDSAVVSSTTPIFTMTLAALLIGERITPYKALGVTVGLVGAIMLVFAGKAGGRDGAVNPVMGNLCCLVAQICAAIYYVVFRKVINRYSPFTLMKWMFLFSSLTYVSFTMGEVASADWINMPWVVYADLAFIIVFPTFISYTLMPFAQQRLKPTLVSMYNYLQPVTSVIYSAILGIAVLTGMKIVAALLIFTGVWIVTQSRNDQRWSDIFAKE